MNCDKHYSIIASKPGTPGAYASCTTDKAYSNYARDFVMRELEAGATVQRVTCNKAHKLLKEYLDWLDKQEAAKSARRASTTATPK